MTQTGVSLDVQNLRKSWGKTEVLMGIDFNVAPGGFLTLLGPSGCGKSTALRLISGLDEVSDGKILIDGVDKTGVAADQRNIGLVFQNARFGDSFLAPLDVRSACKKQRGHSRGSSR